MVDSRGSAKEGVLSFLRSEDFGGRAMYQSL